jgi:beta-fructofuranosidase
MIAHWGAALRINFLLNHTVDQTNRIVALHSHQWYSFYRMCDRSHFIKFSGRIVARQLNLIDLENIMVLENISDMRQRFANDPHRPRYHYLPPSNWMNDPNGVIQWKGKYHLFYQHNPNGPLWGDIHWGHAASQDLIHWTDLPIALAPTPGGPDETGCFSGCAVNNGQPTFVYTGTRGARHEIQTQCIATSSDDLLTWQKYEGNPVLSEVPAESGQTRDFRDPFVWKEGDTWYAVIGSRIQDMGGAIFLYRSPNLIHWEYLNPLLLGDKKQHGAIWECPNFFKLGDQWVLIISAHTGSATGEVFYFVGSYENFRFTPTHEGVLDYGQLYAPLSFVDDQQRRVLFGWLREARSETEQRLAGWSGAQSIPRVLTLDNQHRLLMPPVPELEAIRGAHHHYGPMNITQAIRLDITGRALDIVAEFEPGADGKCGLSIACSPDDSERTDIIYDAATKRLGVHKISSEVHGAINTHIREVPHDMAAGEPLQLRILLDGSVVEIIANQRTSITSRVYPSQAISKDVRILGSKAKLLSLDIWEMPSIWQ